jgi:glyoxylase I family protein
MAQSNHQGRPEPKLLGELPKRLHHNAYVTDDQEKTRRFYEDVLGFPLTAMWIEEVSHGGMSSIMSHAFYGIGDGGALAFFEFADPEIKDATAPKKQSGYVHIALAISEAGQTEIRDRLAAANLRSAVIDHGYCRSLYVEDPNGLTLEFTVDPPHAAEIATYQRETAHKTMQRWKQGDRSPNNALRPHA